ncbi:MAG: hypothetical protein LBQ09_12885, partial [Acidobacteriaceae bacterium]|nr:hypothetical protein [Acidobacteriaceae bacterium]
LDSTQSFAANLLASLRATLDYLPAIREIVPGPLDTIVSFLALMAFVFFVRDSHVQTPRSAKITAWIVGAFSAIYFAGMIALRTRVEFDALNVRLLAPAFLPVMAGFIVAGAVHITARVRTIAIAVLVPAFAAGTLAGNQIPWRGVNEPSLRSSALVSEAERLLREYPGTPILSTKASLLATQLGFDQPIYWTPPTRLPRLDANERAILLIAQGDDNQGPSPAIPATALPLVRTPEVRGWLLTGPLESRR